MDSTTFQGLFLLAVLALCLGFSYYQYKKGKTKTALLGIVMVGLGLRFFCSLDPVLHAWDERYHALVAKNLVTQPWVPMLYRDPVLPFDLKNWSGNSVWLHKQPVPLWMMALSVKAFGSDTLPVRIPSVLVSTLAVMLVFSISKRLFGSDWVALVAAYLQAVNGLLIDLASGRAATDHIDTFFSFFVLLSVWCVVLHRDQTKFKYLIVAGIACGLAVLTKWLPALIVLLLFGVLHWGQGLRKWASGMAVVGVTAGVVFLPWQMYAAHRFPAEFAWEQRHHWLHLTTALDGHGKPWWYFLDRMRTMVHELIYLALGWLGWRLSGTSSLNLVVLLVWAGVPLLFFSLARTKMPGYLAFTFPAYFILMGLFAEWLLEQSSLDFRPWRVWGQKIIVGLVFLLPLRYGLERAKPFQQHDKEAAIKAEIMNRPLPVKAVVFNTPYPIEWMYYRDCVAYPGLPEPGVKERLIQKGYAVVVLEAQH